VRFLAVLSLGSFGFGIDGSGLRWGGLLPNDPQPLGKRIPEQREFPKTSSKKQQTCAGGYLDETLRSVLAAEPEFLACSRGFDLIGNTGFAGVGAKMAVWLQIPGGSGLLGLAPLLFIFAIFYFLLILPQQRKQKKWQAMLSELKTGDKIVTTGGLRGTIISLKDDAVTLRVPPDNLKIEVSRGAVASVTTAEAGK